ncbi:hypothetical protein LTR10_016652 [Elasticomyces elasticus]|uniref:Secreted protein n=1 Tax=Exophiala sideris TaxID=1016849 RepID=A0ABR0JK26_9EURO|nr:hypothetical protein LTR10_016652 [Elasticomyces elasticus]KAK5035298.1 hypothetical protein LTS07_002734 [Exophiala sideris]KAK5039350.1 hypothetical protein LTR13_003607 [Exophiala sideris]KAK5066222.1 hypothetical protein LTR69_002740 [Exophiala sideris]KAK5186899.1 hypothetical protein LTR44_000905 [Eurotiomycetes sp. CCFEE 6388]
MWGTAASWVALLAVTAALTRYYNPDLFNKLTGLTRVRPAPAPSDKGVEKKQKTKRTHAGRVDATNSGTSTPTSATDGTSNKRRKLVSAPIDNTVVAQTTTGKEVSLPRDEEHELSNKQFAQQLAKAQAGTKLESTKSQGTTKKDRRAARKATQTQQNGVETSGISTETSSTTGRDADDDLSPAASPASGPVSTAPTSRAGDVSDMLEAPAAKPTTLRLTDVTETIKKNVPKSVAKAFEPVMTKKQRQRQAKQAEQKALREEADRQHDAKKQAQLRAARMAEGTSNQTKANSFTSKQNAWQQGKPASQELAKKESHTEVAPLLDTFDKSDAAPVNENGAVNSQPLSDVTNSLPATANVNEVRQEEGGNKTTALAASNREKVSRPALESQPSWADEVNEEEQDKWASELTGEEKWESVTSKKGKKKAKKDNETSSETSSSVTRPATSFHNSVTLNGTSQKSAQPRKEYVNRFQSIEALPDSSLKDAEWEA